MGNSFDVVGVLVLASSKRSLKLELNGFLPSDTAYVSVKDVEAVLSGHKQSATVWIRKPQERALSCEAHTS